ncbi:YopX family protein [Fusobacterium varium]|uniref:YopX family protein n=1 Tax=Fusobacterium varium TaxID=856 RepID=UPI003033D310
MKEHNLRFWNKKAKKMMKFEELSMMTLAEVFKNYKVMNSTGLFDRNNNEIFEGDILEIEIEDTGWKRKILCKFGKFKKKIIGIDKKRHEAETIGFFFLSDTFDRLLPTTKDGISDTQKMEKIGNIHENPDLMGW